MAPEADAPTPPRPDAALLIGEMERAHLAEIIHDDVLQTFGAGMLAAETCEQALRLGRHELLPEQLANLQRVLEQGVGRLRHLMADLRPYQPQNGGVEGALQNVFRAYLERTRGAISFVQDLPGPLSNLAELLAYRLILQTLWSVQDLDAPLDIHVQLGAQNGALTIAVLFTSLGSEAPAGGLLAAKRIALLRWRIQALGGSLAQEAPQPAQAQLRIRLPLPA